MLSATAFAINGRTTYQAKIYKPDGQPLESVSVNFRFTVLDPSSSCVLFVEDYAAVNMIGSGGLTSFSLGMGTRSYPVSGPVTFANVFDNSTPSFVCQTPGVYNPLATDNRRIVMQFNDGGGWQTLPAMSINAVPYAMYAAKAQNSQALNGKSDTAFVEYSTLAGLSCAANEALHFNGVNFTCLAAGSAVTSGSVVSALGYTPADGASITAINSSLATTNSNVSAVSSSVAAVSGSVSGLQTSLTSLQNAVAASFAAVTSSQWLTNGSDIYYASGNVGIGTSSPAATLEVKGSTANSGSVRISTDAISNISGTQILSFGTNVSGTYSQTGVIGDTSSGDSNIKIFAVQGNLQLGANTSGVATTRMLIQSDGKVGLGTMTPATALDIAGGVRISMESATCAIGYAGTIRYNSGILEFCNGSDWGALGSSAVTSAAVVAALGYTPENSSVAQASYTAISNSLASVGSSLTATTNAVNAVSASVASLASSYTNLSASVSAITSSQWTTSGSTIHYSGGNVGIGTTNPTDKLQVMGVMTTTSGTGNLSIIPDYMGSAYIQSWQSVGVFRPLKIDGQGISLDAKGGNYNFVSGNVGIGVASAAHKLDVAGHIRSGSATDGSVVTGNDGNALIELRENDNLGTPYIDFANDAVSDFDFRFILNGDDNFLLQGANVGINVASASAVLHLAAGTATNAPLKLTSGTLLSSPQSGTVEFDGTYLYYTDGNNNRRTLLYDSGGNYAVNHLTSPGNITLSPVGSVVVSSTMSSISPTTGALVVNGGLGVAGNINAGGNIISGGLIQAASMTTMRLGVGTSNPANAKIHIGGAPNQIDLLIQPDVMNVSNTATIRFADSDGGTTPMDIIYSDIGVPTLAVSGGYLGVGPNIPRQNLDVAPAAGNAILRATSPNSTSALQLYRNTAGTYHGPVLWSNGGSLNFGYDSSENAGPTLMTLETSGALGIGTQTPVEQLTTTGNAMIGYGGYPAVFIRDSNWWMGILRQANTSWPDADSLVFNAPTGRPFVFQSGAVSQAEGTPRMYIDTTNGHVGIGTTTPSTLNGWGKVLDVHGVSHSKIVATNSTSGVAVTTGIFSHSLVPNGYGGFPQNHGGVGLFGTETAHDLGIMTGNVTRIAVTSGGAVGIGTISPATKLDVNAPDGSGATIRNAAESSDTLQLFNAGANTASRRAVIQGWRDTVGALPLTLNESGGNVGIGTSAPTTILHVVGTATIMNPAGGNYNENLRLPPSTANDHSSIALGTSATLTTGSVTGQWTMIRYPAAEGNRFGLRHHSDAIDALTATTAGNVGIGTHTPAYKLEVAGGDINVPTGRVVFNAGTTAGTAGIASSDAGSIYGEHDLNTEVSRLVIDIFDNPNDEIVLRTSAQSGGQIVDMVKVNYHNVQLAPTTGNVGIGVASAGAKLHVNGGIRQPNLGEIWVTWDGTTRIATVPSFLTDAYMNSHQDEVFTWRGPSPSFKDIAGCNGGPSANYMFSKADGTWGGTYRMIIGKVNATNLIEVEWKGWGTQLLDAGFSVVNTGSNQGSVQATLTYSGGVWTVEHMQGQVGTTPFSCH